MHRGMAGRRPTSLSLHRASWCVRRWREIRRRSPPGHRAPTTAHRGAKAPRLDDQHITIERIEDFFGGIAEKRALGVRARDGAHYHGIRPRFAQVAGEHVLDSACFHAYAALRDLVACGHCTVLRLAFS